MIPATFGRRYLWSPTARPYAVIYQYLDQLDVFALSHRSGTNSPANDCCQVNEFELLTFPVATRTGIRTRASCGIPYRLTGIGQTEELSCALLQSAHGRPFGNEPRRK